MTSVLKERLRAIPKAELHVHLEGTVSVATRRRLARKYGVDLTSATKLPTLSGEIEVPGPDAAWIDGDFRGTFRDFIAIYVKISSLLREAEDIELVADEYLKQASYEGVVHAEVYVTPTTLLMLGLPENDLFGGLIAAQRSAESVHGVKLRWIFDIVRNSKEPGSATLECITRARAAGVDVCAIGLGGYELGHPASLFAETFRDARAGGIPAVIHAGETDGAASVRDAIETSSPLRIGHGVRSLEDPSVVNLLNERKIPLEVCPISNVVLGVSPFESHPIAALLAAGLTCVIGADDPGIFGATLLDNYEYSKAMGVEPEKLEQLAHESMNYRCP